MTADKFVMAISIPSVTAIIPAFNASQFINEALESLALQTIKPEEVILVDDGSTDDTRRKVEQWQAANGQLNLRLISQANAGVSAARNKGIANASGNYIINVDADDYLESNHIESLVLGMNTFPEAHCVFGAANHYDALLNRMLAPLKTRVKALACSESQIGYCHLLNNNKLFSKLLTGNFILPSAFMFRKSIEGGPFYNESFCYGEDRLFLLNLIKTGVCVYVDMDIAKIRRHADNATNDHCPQRAQIIALNTIHLTEYLLKQQEFALTKEDIDSLNSSMTEQVFHYAFASSRCGIGCFLNNRKTHPLLFARIRKFHQIGMFLRASLASFMPQAR